MNEKKNFYKILGFCFAFVFVFLPKQTFARSIDFYGSNDSLCATCSQSTCTYSGSGYCSTIKRVSIQDGALNITSGHNYQLTSMIYLDILKNETCTNNNLGLRNDFYIGNYNGSSWNNASSVYSNSVSDINVGVNGSCRYTWNLDQRFTSTITSTGIRFDFYFSTPQNLQRISINTMSLNDITSSGSSNSDIINNQNSNTQSIINNNNQNTQNIINNNNSNTDRLLDDTTNGAESMGDYYFNNFSNNDHGLTGIITAPLRLIQSLASATCSPLSLPLPFVNQNATLPCIKAIVSQHFPTFLTLYQLITTGVIAYWVLVKIFQKVKAFKDPNDDKVEVFDL